MASRLLTVEVVDMRKLFKLQKLQIDFGDFERDVRVHMQEKSALERETFGSN